MEGMSIPTVLLIVNTDGTTLGVHYYNNIVIRAAETLLKGAGILVYMQVKYIFLFSTDS